MVLVRCAVLPRLQTLPRAVLARLCGARGQSGVVVRWLRHTMPPTPVSHELAALRPPPGSETVCP